MTKECKHRTFIVKANITYCRKCKSRLPRYRHEQARDIITRGKLIRYEEPAPTPPPEQPKLAPCSHYPVLEGKYVVCAFCREALNMDRQRMADEILMERTISEALQREASKRISKIVDSGARKREAAWQSTSMPFDDGHVCPHFWKPSGIGTWECAWCPELRSSITMPVS